MIDSSKLGAVTAKVMDALDTDFPDGGVEMQAALIVCVVIGENGSYTRVYSSDQLYYQQIGLLEAGLECVRDGEVVQEEEENDE